MTAAVLSVFQNGPVDNACFYDARLGPSIYGGMFNPMTHKPLSAYYSFVFFNELYKLGTQIKAESDDEDVYVLSASDGKTAQTMVINTVDTTKPLDVKLNGKITACKLLGATLIPEDTDLPCELAPETVLLITSEI